MINQPEGHQWFVSLITCPDGSVAAGTLVLAGPDEDPADLVRRDNPNDADPVVVPVSRVSEADNTPVVISA